MAEDQITTSHGPTNTTVVEVDRSTRPIVHDVVDDLIVARNALEEEGRLNVKETGLVRVGVRNDVVLRIEPTCKVVHVKLWRMRMKEKGKGRGSVCVCVCGGGG